MAWETRYGDKGAFDEAYIVDDAGKPVRALTEIIEFIEQR